MTWQPIETAPKDGKSPVLIWDGKIQCVAEFTFQWANYEGRWVCIGASGWECENDFGDPTHWMPLPEPPKD